MAYGDREIAAMRRVLASLPMEKAGLRVEKKKTSDFPVPEELKDRFRRERP